MKHGKKPTAAQRKMIERIKSDPHMWLVAKDTPEELVLVHRHFNKTKIVPKWMVTDRRKENY